MDASKQPLQIDIVSDVMCPWCWVGKRKLEGAMRAVEHNYSFQVRWLPYLLRHDVPVEGIPKPPNTPDNPRVGQRLKQAGKAVGIDFTGKTDRVPNTLQAHALLEYVLHHHGNEKQNDMSEIIFKAYFTDGLYPDTETLVTLAEQQGYERDAVRAYITDQSNLKSVSDEAVKHSRDGVTGVPSFYINGVRAFSGAQDEATFIRVFDIVAKKHPLAATQGAAL